MEPHGKELSVALHKDGVSYKKIAKILKRSCSTVAKTYSGLKDFECNTRLVYNAFILLVYGQYLNKYLWLHLYLPVCVLYCV